MQLGHAILADNRWRIFAFAPTGDHGQPGGRIHALCDYLESGAKSPVRRPHPRGRRLERHAICAPCSSSTSAIWITARCVPLCVRTRAPTACATMKKCSAPTSRAGKTFSRCAGSTGRRAAWWWSAGPVRGAGPPARCPRRARGIFSRVSSFLPDRPTLLFTLTRNRVDSPGPSWKDCSTKFGRMVVVGNSEAGKGFTRLCYAAQFFFGS